MLPMIKQAVDPHERPPPPLQNLIKICSLTHVFELQEGKYLAFSNHLSVPKLFKVKCNLFSNIEWAQPYGRVHDLAFTIHCCIDILTFWGL